MNLVPWGPVSRSGHLKPLIFHDRNHPDPTKIRESKTSLIRLILVRFLIIILWFGSENGKRSESATMSKTQSQDLRTSESFGVCLPVERSGAGAGDGPGHAARHQVAPPDTRQQPVRPVWNKHIIISARLSPRQLKKQQLFKRYISLT